MEKIQLSYNEIELIFNIANELLSRLPEGQRLSFNERVLIRKLYNECDEDDRELLMKLYPKVLS